MAYKDLQEFIDLLENRGHLKRIKTPISAGLEITEITGRICKGPLEDYHREWPELIEMDPAVKAKIDQLWAKLGL